MSAGLVEPLPPPLPESKGFIITLRPEYISTLSPKCITHYLGVHRVARRYPYVRAEVTVFCGTWEIVTPAECVILGYPGCPISGLACDTINRMMTIQHLVPTL